MSDDNSTLRPVDRQTFTPTLGTPDPFAALKDRVIRAAVKSRTMPLYNLRGMHTGPWAEYFAAVDALIAAGWKEGM